ncbi:MAG: pseudouridine synthase [Simkaniaceae bacterium]
MEEARLSKALAAAGIASRRGAENLIFEGCVKVNGQIIKVPQTMVRLGLDDIEVHGKKLTKEQQKIYYILNKPKGFICTHRRPGSKKIIYDLFPQENRRLFSIGRLDRETTGLLILTNDGAFANQVIHPSQNIKKEYLVKTREFITDEHLKRIGKGALVEGKWVRPVSIKKVRKGTLKIIVKEGRKREVRTLVEKADLQILELHRIRIGSLLLGNLPVGQYRKMTEEDKQLIFT